MSFSPKRSKPQKCGRGVNSSSFMEQPLPESPKLPRFPSVSPCSRTCLMRHAQPHPEQSLQYNKWYIEPKLRYLRKHQNPKSNLKAYADEQYVYNNLHNGRFWDWEHPLEKRAQGDLPAKVFAVQPDDVRKNKLNIKVLDDFCRELERNRMRLPLIVQEVLKENAQ